jgi:hypothetical protein
LGRSRGNNCNAGGSPDQVLSRKAKLVGEGTQGVAIAEGVRVPEPHDRARSVGDLMRAPEMIWGDKKVPRWLKHRDRQIAKPRRLPKRVAEAIVFAGLMARLVIDEEELRRTRRILRYALPQAVDQPARADRSDKSLRLTIARVVGKSVIGKRRRIKVNVAGGVIGETSGPAAAFTTTVLLRHQLSLGSTLDVLG